MWTSLLVAAASIITAATTAIDGKRKARNDFEIVAILAEQLAEARRNCQ